MNNILVTTSSFDGGGMGFISLLEKKGFNVIVNPYKRKVSKEEILGLIKEYNPIGILAGVEVYDKEVIDAATNLKILSRIGVGVDSVDTKYMVEKSISVTITPTATTIAVAEFTIGMILALLRNIPAYDASFKRGEWKRLEGSLLNGKKVGIIGCGRIGTKVATILKAFDCVIVGYDAHIQHHDWIPLIDLNSLLNQSDIISLHVPYMDENKHLINSSNGKEIKKGAYLLNIARGGLVDETILPGLISDGTLKGIAFDCFENEPYTGELTGIEQAVITPHTGSAASEARVLMEQEAIENLLKSLSKL